MSGPARRPSLEFIGTATTLLRLGPFTLLTDPNFLHRGQRAYLGKGLFSKRLTEPSMQSAVLPSYGTSTHAGWSRGTTTCSSGTARG